MNINAGIIDQHVRGLAQRLQGRIEEALERKLDEIPLRSAAFVVMCVKTMLDLTDEEALECLTEGGNDFGVDAIEVGDIVDGEFTVTLFQGKYHHNNLDGVRGFPEDAVRKAVEAVRALFNPSAPVDLNRRLQTVIEEIRSLILDGNIPRIRFLLCSNGATWSKESQAIIDRERFGERVSFERVNHDTLVGILQSIAPVKDALQFTGKSLVEDLNYVRVFIGKMSVVELARLMHTHGDRLLERNIRRYLGLGGNRVNEAILRTLRNSSERSNFYFYNNGVTLICDRFDYNALQSENHKVRVEGLKIINGGQTSKTVEIAVNWPTWPLVELDLLGESPKQIDPALESVFVLVRLYQVPRDATNLVDTITYATNNQNPVDLKDLRANDEIQKQLEMSMTSLGYEYRRKRSEGTTTAKEIGSGTAAEAVLSVWRRRPQQAKFHSGEHFGKLYSEIFTSDLNAAQVVIAVLLLRIAENKRRRPPSGAPELVRYASCFAAMLMGQYLLTDLRIGLEKLDHRTFAAAQTLVEEKGEAYFAEALRALEKALGELYGDQPVSLQRLAATFRRGDLLEYLI